MKSKFTLDFIIFSMDDNKESSRHVKHASERWLTNNGNFCLDNLIGNSVTRSRESRDSRGVVRLVETQPDSCLSWYNFATCTVTACVINKIDQLADHFAIRIRIDLKGVPPRVPIYRDSVRSVKVLKDDVIADELEDRCKLFMNKFSKATVTDRSVDQIAQGYYKLISGI